MVEMKLALSFFAQHPRHSGGGFEQSADGIQLRFVVQVYMSYLVVRDGEDCAGAEVKEFTVELFTDRDQALLAKDPVEMDRAVDRSDAKIGRAPCREGGE